MYKEKIFWDKQVGEEWASSLEEVLTSSHMEKLMAVVDKEYATQAVYPKKKNVFRAFRECPLESFKVLIIGMDPYNNGTAKDPRATGLAFANSEEVSSLSPSLRVIRDRLEEDFKTVSIAFDQTLTSWATQGVLLLNSSLSVRAHQAGSHKKIWRPFMKELLSKYLDREDLKVLLWGKDAQELSSFLPLSQVYKAEHPSYAARQGRSWNCPHFKDIPEISWLDSGFIEQIQS